MENMGNQIKLARVKRGLSQEELGKAIGATKSTISKYELGHREPSFEQLQRIADALYVTVGYLQGYESLEVRAILDAIKRKDAREFERLLGLDAGSITNMDEELADGESIISTLARTDDEADRLADILDATKRLNPVGQCIAVERVRELGKIPEYRAETAPESTSPPSEGKDTTPPPDAPETPPEGE